MKGEFIGKLVMVGLAAAVLLAACDSGGGDSAVTYTVTFSAGDGSGEPPTTQTAVAGTVITLPGMGSMSAPFGKIFAGWKADDDPYQEGGSYTVNTDVTFTAQWIEDGKTYVSFTNLEQFPVSIYKDAARLTEIALVPASGTMNIESEPAPNGATFYSRFHVSVDGLEVFTQDAPAITVRVDAHRITTITIPRITAITTTIACIKIDNQSIFSLTLTQGGVELRPQEGASTILMPQENAVYAVQAGNTSGYAFMQNTSNPIVFSQIISEFQGGKVYMFRYNGAALVLTGVEDVFGTPFDLVFTVSTAAEMAAVLASVSADLNCAIQIAQSFSSGPVSLSRSITIQSSNSGEKIITLTGGGSLFTVGDGVTLTLGANVTLQGLTSNTAPLVTVNSGGTLAMNAGSKISGNTTSSAGGGVHVAGGGTFTMSGGEISGNSASSSGGGVYVASGGAFTKQTGGTIYGSDDANTSLRNTASSDSYGHAVYVAASPAKKRNTTVGSGVTLDSAVSGAAGGWADPLPSNLLTLNESLTWISDNATGGDAYAITLNANETITPETLSYSGKTVNITITGGSTERTISLSSTGSLFTIGSGVTLTLGANITLQGRSSNTASLVVVSSGGRLVMNAGSKISGNSTSSHGGGVYVSGGTFTMSGGEISGNTASSYGGGVYVSYGGTFTKQTGGTVYGSDASATLKNTASGTSYGHAVYVRHC
ncbi:MAG: InlB B-repeat-containing protein [Treponema sp.]|nr:InlB B-repeat-containing protein [Treponema sp.]